MTLEAGTKLGKYEIRSLIGVGGMGEVYLADDTGLERQVALKILLAEIADNADRIRRFVQEAKAASALNHPNILTVYEIGEFESSHYIATELIKGKTLRNRLHGESLTLRETLDIAMQVAAALNAAHEAGIVHRDIKPENIMLRDDGLVKVLDFGLAKLTEKQSESTSSEDATRAHVNTRPGMIMGTVAYMSPEQTRGKDVDARSDIWSLGVVVYEMLAGTTPFAGETPNDSIAAILTKDPSPVREDAPAELQRIVRKSLQKKADERYQTVKDLLLDVKNLKKELEFSEELERSQMPISTGSSNVSTGQVSENSTAMHPAVSTQNSVPAQLSSAEYIVGEIKSHKKSVTAILAIFLIALIGGGYWFFANRGGGSGQINSIAVMPFVNDSGNADVDYLSDGMTETLINSLSQIPNLSVKARSSVFRYKGKDIDPKKIASELGVQAILTGHVIQRGDQLTLSVELIDGLTENTIWGNKYERKGSDLVSLQSEVARDVSGKLKSKISGADAAKVEKSFTANPEAYQLYLKGTYYWNKRTADNLKRSIQYFNQAIEKDPGYAQAYAGMALAYVLLPEYFGGAVEDSLSKGTAAARRALELDSSLAEAHVALSHAFADDLKFAESSQELQQAIELNPNYATAHQWYAINLCVMGKFDEGIAEGRRAQEIDPLSLIVNENLAEFYYYAGQYDKALEQEKATIALDPSFFLAHLGAGQAYEMKGMYPEALAEYKRVQELNDDPNYYLAALGHLYAVTGKRDEALKVLDQMKELSATRHVARYDFATIYIALDDKDKAIQNLEEDYQAREASFRYVAVDPVFNGLRSDPRFVDLLHRAGFSG